MRVITAYAHCGSARSRSETYYRQQVRYIPEKALKTNPKDMFQEDLLTQMRKWKAKGDSEILMMNANTDVIEGAICKQLGKDNLNMREVVYSQTN